MNGQAPAPSEKPAPNRSPRISPPVAIIGVAIAVGLALVLIALILRTDPGGAAADAGTSPSPSATPSNLADASPSSVPTSSAPLAATPSPIAATPHSSGGPAPYPVKGSADPALMIAGPDGGVYVAVRDGNSTVVGFFAPDGSVGPGWPVRLDSTFCSSIHAARDGSVRVACTPPEDGSEGLGPTIMRLFAIDREAHPMRGWPVDIENGSAAGIQGDDVGVTLRSYCGEGCSEGDVEPIGLAVIGADGHVQTGQGLVEATCCDSTTAIGPAAGYLVNRAGDLVDTGSSELIAFGLNGVRWRSPIGGIASDPAFDARGNAYVSAWAPGLSKSRMFVFDPDGHAVAFNTHSLPIVPTNGSAPAGPEHPVPPTVRSDGSSFLVEEKNDASILALDSAGNPRRGWPVNWVRGLEHAGDCGQDTGCGLPTVMPAVGPDSSLYVALNATGSGAGGSVTALSPAGKVRSGWPVGLKRRGAQFWKVVAGSDGGIWALAAEPDKDGYDATLLSIAPDSTIRGKVTLVEAAPIGP